MVPGWKLALVFGATAALLGCAEKNEVLRRSSAPQPPKWTVSLPRDQTYLYFAGAKSGAPSLEDGRSAALASALAQASQYIGVKIVAEDSAVDSTLEHERKVRSDVRARTGGEVRGAEVADVYFESVSRVVGAAQFDRFDVWVLVRFPRAEAERERERREAERRATAEGALAHHARGREAAARGDYRRAVQSFAEARRALGGLDEAVALDRAGFATSRELEQAVAQALEEAISERRRTAVVFSERSLGAASPAAVSPGRIAEVLAARGFNVLSPLRGDPADVARAIEAAKRAGARIAVLVTADAARTGTVFGTQAACTATVQARAIDVATREVLAQVDRQGRGIKGDPGVAAWEALREAAEQAAGALAAALLEREGAAP